MIKYKAPLIVVNNIENSKNFYEKILKQKIKNDYGGIVFFESGFVIQLKKNFKKLINNKKNGNIKFESNSFELYFETDNLDKIYNRLKKENIKFLHKPEIQPWGQKVIRFYDPDKHIVEVGETMESMVERLYKQGYSPKEMQKKVQYQKNLLMKE